MRELNKKLQDLYSKLNTELFEGQLPYHVVKFRRGAFQTQGRINLTDRKIMISHLLLEQYGWPQVEQTLLHEMTHALIHMQGGQARHTKKFWSEFEKRGGVRDKIQVKPKEFYVYACPSCGMEYERVRKMKVGKYSCSKCDSNFNINHRLYLKRDKGQKPLSEFSLNDLLSS